MSHETITLALEDRTVIGKRLRDLRISGQVPAVIHDHGRPSLIVQAEYNAAYKTFLQAGKHHIVSLQLGGKAHNAIIKDVSLDPRKNTVTHIVFNAVNANEKITTDVPVHFQYAEGNDATPAERSGLIVLHNAETVEIEALPKDLPDALLVNAEKLIVAGDQVTVADLIVPAGVEIKEEPEHVLATVFEPSALAAANDAAGGDAEEAVATEEVAEEAPEAAKE